MARHRSLQVERILSEKNFQAPLEPTRSNDHFRYITENPTEMKLSPLTGGGPYVSTNPKFWKGVTAEDIPQGWMDDMIKRLFDELNRELIRVEDKSRKQSDKEWPQTREPPETPADRAANARTLASLQHTLERLTRMELQRQSLRETKVGPNHDGAREELERRIDRLAAAVATPLAAEKPQQ